MVIPINIPLAHKEQNNSARSSLSSALKLQTYSCCDSSALGSTLYRTVMFVSMSVPRTSGSGCTALSGWPARARCRRCWDRIRDWPPPRTPSRAAASTWPCWTSTRAWLSRSLSTVRTHFCWATMWVSWTWRMCFLQGYIVATQLSSARELILPDRSQR